MLANLNDLIEDIFIKKINMILSSGLKIYLFNTKYFWLSHAIMKIFFTTHGLKIRKLSYFLFNTKRSKMSIKEKIKNRYFFYILLESFLYTYRIAIISLC